MTAFAISIADGVGVVTGHSLNNLAHYDSVITSERLSLNYLYHRETVTATDEARAWFSWSVAVAQETTSLNVIRGSLTGEGRKHLSRAIHDGSLVTPYRFVLGTGWNDQRWNNVPHTDVGVNTVIAQVFMGTVADGFLTLEKANASTIVVRCVTPVALNHPATEILIWARIKNSTYFHESGREIPFASARFPTWYHSTNQRFVARIVIPLGMGVASSEVTGYEWGTGTYGDVWGG